MEKSDKVCKTVGLCVTLHTSMCGLLVTAPVITCMCVLSDCFYNFPQEATIDKYRVCYAS